MACANGGLGIDELTGGVRVAVQRKEAAARRAPARRQRVIEILSCGIAIDLDGHAPLRRRRKYGVPIGDHARPRSGDPAARVGQDPNRRVRDAVSMRSV